MDTSEQRSRSQVTREAILRAARRRFATDGFQRTTIRAVAGDAHIDPSMVMRYYGSKQGLFAAATTVDLRLPDLGSVPRAQLGRAAVEHFLSRWEEDPDEDSLRVLLATAVTSPATAEQLHTVLSAQLQPLVAAVGPHDPDEAAVRAGLVATQLLGVALCRYVLRLPPVVAMPPEALVGWLAPTVERYLTGTAA